MILHISEIQSVLLPLLDRDFLLELFPMTGQNKDSVLNTFTRT